MQGTLPVHAFSDLWSLITSGRVGFRLEEWISQTMVLASWEDNFDSFITTETLGRCLLKKVIPILFCHHSKKVVSQDIKHLKQKAVLLKMSYSNFAPPRAPLLTSATQTHLLPPLHAKACSPALPAPLQFSLAPIFSNFPAWAFSKVVDKDWEQPD